VEPRRPRGACCQAYFTASPKPDTNAVTKAHKQPKVTAPVRKAKPKKAEPKVAATPKAAVKPKKVTAPGTKPVAPAPLVAQPHPTPSPLEGIADLVDQLPLGACAELTRRLLTAIPSFPKGATRPRAVLKLVILFVADYGSTP
jgi:outer membrane biosynthesis protein TonB